MGFLETARGEVVEDPTALDTTDPTADPSEPVTPDDDGPSPFVDGPNAS